MKVEGPPPPTLLVTVVDFWTAIQWGGWPFDDEPRRKVCKVGQPAVTMPCRERWKGCPVDWAL